MTLAGHADFATTHRFYLAVSEDFVQRARVVSAHTMNKDFVANLLQTQGVNPDEKGSLNVNNRLGDTY